MTFSTGILGIDIGLTVLIGLILIAGFIIEHRFIKKNEDDLKRHQIFLIYGATIVIVIGAIIGVMAIWSFDFASFFASAWASIVDFVSTSVPALIGTAIALAVAIFLIRIFKIIFKQIGQKPGPLQRRKRTIAKISLSIIKYLTWIVDIIVILAIWGFDVLPALAGLGIMGLIIGLGAQKFINDLIAGFFIVFEQHFDVGDIIEVAGFKGEVIDIGLKTTKIRNWKGEIRMMSNGDVANVINYSKNPSIGIVDFDIAYKEDIQKTTELLKAELPKFRTLFPIVIEDPAVLGTVNLAASGVTLRVIVKTENEKHYGVERALRQFIKEVLDANGIEIPFPQVVVHRAE